MQVLYRERNPISMSKLMVSTRAGVIIVNEQEFIQRNQKSTTFSFFNQKGERQKKKKEKRALRREGFLQKKRIKPLLQYSSWQEKFPLQIQCRLRFEAWLLLQISLQSSEAPHQLRPTNNTKERKTGHQPAQKRHKEIH
jgi:hypothetical protein